VPESDHLHVQAFEGFRIQEAREGVAAPEQPMATLRELNVWLNELLGGEEGQTMSARMGKRIQEGDASVGERALCEVLDMIDPEHCERAAEAFDEDDDTEEVCVEDPETGKRHRYRHHHHRPVMWHGAEHGHEEEPWWLRPRPGDEDDD